MTTLQRAIDIPTNLLSPHSHPDAFFGFSPMAEKALLQRFLPFNSGDDSDTDPYSTDHFRMYEFKVRRCTRPRCHDWTDCPFVHPGEKARRRDPRKYHYSGNVCAEFRRGSCSRGDNCEFAHGVFETWLHPAKYRTEACKDGKNCKRKICFFAHTPRQLRLLPPSPPPEKASSVAGLARDYLNLNHGCRFCHSPVASPTSTLLGMSHFDKLSPPMSPPSLLSPVKSHSLAGFSPISCGAKPFNSSPLSYRDVVNELRVSMEEMKLIEDSINFKNLPWVDDGGCRNGGGGGDERGQSLLPPRRGSVESGSYCPDIDWVNDLLT